MSRDSYEPVRRFLSDAAERPDFATRAFERIAAQDAELGDSYLWTARRVLLRELTEEALDLAAWSALAAARVDHDRLEPARAQRTRALLCLIARAGDRADELIAELGRLLLDEPGGTTPATTTTTHEGDT